MIFNDVCVPSMTPSEIKKFRSRHKISLLELSAATSLPAAYLGKLEEEEAPALATDLSRIGAALEQIVRDRAETDVT